MGERAVCTIVSNNYLAYARVFAESYLEHHPDARIFTCVVDRRDPEVPYESFPFTTIFADELGIPAFLNFAFRYSILELNTAVKPYLLAHLRERHGISRALYFDPDILVLRPLPELWEALDEHAMLLTPHLTQPLDESQRALERQVLMAGVYNLGFLGLRLDGSTERFLAWWQDRLYRFCLSDIHHGLFVDQSWMDLAPCLVDGVRVLRSPAYNVAYWNLPYRTPERVEGGWRVEGEPLGFFHFSGVDVRDIDRVSKHQDGIHLSRRPELRPLFEHYRELLLAAGHERLRHRPYGYGTFSGRAVPVNWVARRLLQRVDPYGRRFPDPFDMHRADSFFEWLVDPLPFKGGALNRMALGLWEERVDLIRSFGDPCGRDLARYVDWLVRCGEGERAGVPPVFLASVRAHQPDRPTFSYELHPYDATVVDTGLELLGRLDLAHPGEMTAWLNEKIPGTARPEPTITRLALLLYRSRNDVQSNYPDPLASDQTAFAYWFTHVGSRELRLHPSLVEPVLRTLPLRNRLSFLWRSWSERPASNGHHPPEAVPRPEPIVPAAVQPRARRARREAARGVNVAGYFDHPTGVGQVARGSLAALEHAGVPTARVPLGVDPWGRTILGKLYQPQGVPFPVTLLHANADQTSHALTGLPAAALVGSTTIGYWFWELSHFPLHYAEAFRHLDEVWAPSRFCQEAFQALAPVPVRLVPPCALPPSPERSDPAAWGLEPGRFHFFFAFDVASIPERKNPFGLLDAFGRLRQATRADVGLVLRINQADLAPELAREVRRRAEGVGATVVDRPLTKPAVDGLLAACDAYVSLHRSEGLGLPPIEALYLGKPVVATNYGGVVDFLDESTGYPVDYSLTALDRDHPPYPKGAVWAEPSVQHAAEQMRRVVEDREEARRRAEAGRRRVIATYGVEAAAARLAAELARLEAELPEPEPREATLA
jgi:glycosyltransferase involved in cell wall biosynthesis